ncbi:hypothetical protein RclHR1_22130003 [Rhizophagus clarus]|uniref:SAM domain-containing protein n=1 Tax=Rhizophagus clarus TaxID=94130 RepID=A0A2Z6QYM8_9GLOM|nr:hypothetical protein RclHR1_22130003 [Rhizophagus clarus]
MEIQVSSLDDILAEVHFYVEKLTGDKDIMHSDYSVSFKSEKATGVGSQLVDLQDYKKFLLDYKNLIEKRKNMAIIVSLKKDKKQKRKEVLHSEDSEDENTNLQKRKKKGIPKLDNFSEVLQQEGCIIRELRDLYKCDQHNVYNTQIPNLPIFSQSNSVKTFASTTNSTTSIPITSNSNFNTTPFFFAIPPQIFSFMHNATINNSPNSPSNILSSPRQPVPSLDEFFIKLDESSKDGEEFTTKFKDIFKEERISINQIYDLTNMEFDKLGMNKIGWRKAFRVAAKCYK